METIIKKLVLAQFLIAITCTCCGMQKDIKFDIQFSKEDKEITAIAEREEKTSFGSDFKRTIKTIILKTLNDKYFSLQETTKDEDSTTGATYITKYFSPIEIKNFGEKEENESEIEKILKEKIAQKEKELVKLYKK